MQWNEDHAIAGELEGDLVVRGPAGWDRLAPGAAGDVVKTIAGKWAAGAPSGGAVVQVVTALGGSVLESTTLSTFQDTSLVASITPLFADSVLLVYTAGLGSTEATSNAFSRTGQWRLFNETDAVALDGANNVFLGRDVQVASADGARSWHAVSLLGRYQVNSLTQRTIRLQFRTQLENLLTRFWADVTRPLMVIMETRP